MITHASTLDTTLPMHFYPTEAISLPHLHGWLTNSLQSIDAVIVLAKSLHNFPAGPTVLPHAHPDG